MENENPRRMGLDSQTIQSAVEGNQSALAQIYDAYALSIYRYHFSRVTNASDAEDLTSQTFMSVIQSLARYHHRDNFTAWSFQIARHRLLDHFRWNHSSGQIK